MNSLSLTSLTPSKKPITYNSKLTIVYTLGILKYPLFISIEINVIITIITVKWIFNKNSYFKCDNI